jgi:hypothetical protein
MVQLEISDILQLNTDMEKFYSEVCTQKGKEMIA